MPFIIQNLIFAKKVDGLGKILAKAERAFCDILVYCLHFRDPKKAWNDLILRLGPQLNDVENEIGRRRKQKIFRLLSNANNCSLEKFREDGFIIDNCLQYNKFIISEMAF